jgi:molybdenum cofactor cytidylyltransferase
MSIDAVEAIAGVVLAAGASTRMGTNKLLLPIEGESLLRRAVRRALAAGLDPLVVVTGHEADRSRVELEGLSCRIVFNPRFAEGIHTSVRTGIEDVPASSPAAVVMLADMPYVTSEMVAALVEAYRRSKPPLVISQYGDAQAPPTLYDRSLFAELTIEPGEGCSKRVVRRHRDEALALVWPAPALTDLDFPEDYDRARSAGSAEARCAPTS